MLLNVVELRRVSNEISWLPYLIGALTKLGGLYLAETKISMLPHSIDAFKMF